MSVLTSDTYHWYNRGNADFGGCEHTTFGYHLPCIACRHIRELFLGQASYTRQPSYRYLQSLVLQLAPAKRTILHWLIAQLIPSVVLPGEEEAEESEMDDENQPREQFKLVDVSNQVLGLVDDILKFGAKMFKAYTLDQGDNDAERRAFQSVLIAKNDIFVPSSQPATVPASSSSAAAAAAAASAIVISDDEEEEEKYTLPPVTARRAALKRRIAEASQSQSRTPQSQSGQTTVSEGEGEPSYKRQKVDEEEWHSEADVFPPSPSLSPVTPPPLSLDDDVATQAQE